jgi:hypothetical protein
MRRQCQTEIETRRASELKSAVRQGAGLYPRCCAEQKEEKGMEADANTAKLTALQKKAKGSLQDKLVYNA